MRARASIHRAIARAFLSAWPDPLRMVERAGDALGYRWTSLYALADEVLALFGTGAPGPTLRRLTSRIASAEELFRSDPEDEVAAQLGFTPEVRALFVIPALMRPAKAWPVPPITTELELARFLALDVRDLALVAGRASSHNYHYRWVTKASGAPRLLEAPKTRLKLAQRKVERELLRAIPPSDAAHGFVRGRSTVTHAREHAGRHLVIRMDLAEFFCSISAGRAAAIFRTAGYPEAIAVALARVTTNTTPRDVLRARRRDLDPWVHALLSRRHLPQGAPSSPAIANLAAYHLDRRLLGLAASFGATYTRYADDLAFSGDLAFAKKSDLFIRLVTVLTAAEGFRINARKTRLMRRGVRQVLTGVVVNAHPNLRRDEYETLKAVLHNAATRGPRDIDDRDTLRGKIAYLAMLNGRRGAKLAGVFARIPWPSR